MAQELGPQTPEEHRARLVDTSFQYQLHQAPLTPDSSPTSRDEFADAITQATKSRDPNVQRMAESTRLLNIELLIGPKLPTAILAEILERGISVKPQDEPPVSVEG